MDLSPATLCTGLLVGTVGFSLFLYGKKQAALPQAIAGLLLMLLPFVLTNAWWMAAGATATLLGMQAARRAEH